MIRPLDFSPITNVLAQYRSDAMDRDRMAQQNRQFEATNALAERQFGEQQRQFNSNFGLRRSEMEEANRRFGLSHSLDERRVAATEAESSDRRMKTALDQAAGVAQMVQSNPALAQQRWQKMIASNPMWGKVLAEAGIDPTDWKGGSDYVIAKARGLTEPPRGTVTNVPPGGTLYYTDPKTGATRQIGQGGERPMDSATRKAIYEAQDELPNLQQAIESLQRAEGLLPDIYTGFGAGIRSALNQGTPGPDIITDSRRAAATQQYNQIMNAEAISAMSQVLKGATTDREMAAFVRIMNDESTSIDTKRQTLQRMILSARRHHQNKLDRIRELGGRIPDMTTPVPGAPTDPSKMSDDDIKKALGL